MKLFQRLIPLALLVGCNDGSPLEPSVPCTGTCVTPFWTNIENFVLTIGDTVRLSARPLTADGLPVAPQWSVATGPVQVDGAGLVRGLAAGRGIIRASANGDPGYVALADLRVVHPDSSGQPFIVMFRDAATGELFSRRQGFTNRDSVDVIINYVLGTTTVTQGAPHVNFEVRGNGQSQCACLVYVSAAVPLPERGKTGFVTYRLHLTEKDPAGFRRMPSGFYDFFVLLPLADGRVLGSETGYPVSF